MDLHVCNPNFKTVREHERQIVIDDDLAAQVMTNEWKRNQGRRKRVIQESNWLLRRFTQKL